MGWKKVAATTLEIARKTGLADSLHSLCGRIIETRVLREAPPSGTPVLCSLAGCVEHSGIFLGDGLVAEMRGDGLLHEVSLNVFLHGDEVAKANPRRGNHIYAACDDESGRPVTAPEACENARRFIVEKHDVRYNIFANNCHKFTASCVCGELVPAESNNSKIEGSTAVTLSLDAIRNDEVFSIEKLTAIIERVNNGKPVVWIPVDGTVVGFSYTSIYESPREVQYNVSSLSNN